MLEELRQLVSLINDALASRESSLPFRSIVVGRHLGLGRTVL